MMELSWANAPTPPPAPLRLPHHRHKTPQQHFDCPTYPTYLPTASNPSPPRPLAKNPRPVSPTTHHTATTPHPQSRGMLHYPVTSNPAPHHPPPPRIPSPVSRPGGGGGIPSVIRHDLRKKKLRYVHGGGGGRGVVSLFVNMFVRLCGSRMRWLRGLGGGWMEGWDGWMDGWMDGVGEWGLDWWDWCWLDVSTQVQPGGEKIGRGVEGGEGSAGSSGMVVTGEVEGVGRKCDGQQVGDALLAGGAGERERGGWRMGEGIMYPDGCGDHQRHGPRIPGLRGRVSVENMYRQQARWLHVWIDWHMTVWMAWEVVSAEGTRL